MPRFKPFKCEVCAAPGVTTAPHQKMCKPCGVRKNKADNSLALVGRTIARGGSPIGAIVQCRGCSRAVLKEGRNQKYCDRCRTDKDRRMIAAAEARRVAARARRKANGQDARP